MAANGSKPTITVCRVRGKKMYRLSWKSVDGVSRKQFFPTHEAAEAGRLKITGGIPPEESAITGKPVKSSRSIPDEGATPFILTPAIFLVGLIGLGLLIRLIFNRDYDNDEIQHAHFAWLVSLGKVPYRDFIDNHFPFFWILTAPLISVLPASPVALMVLRGLALLLNAIFIAALGALIAQTLPPKQRLWGHLFLAFAVFSPPIAQILIEFRPDALANALLFSALAWLGSKGFKKEGATFLCGCGIGMAVLINTKCAPFILWLGGVALVMHLRSWRQIVRPASVIGLGFSFALLAAAVLMEAGHIPFDGAYQMVVAFNASVEKVRTYGFGLAHALSQNPELLAYGLLGVIACVTIFIRERRRPDVISVAILCFLIGALFTTTRPWKQYYAPWLLLAAYFPARSFPQLITRWGATVQTALVIGALAVIGMEFTKIKSANPNGVGMPRATQDQVIRWVVQHVPVDGYIVATSPIHPVFRQDSFAKVFTDMTQAGGDGFEQFMPGLVAPSVAECLQQSGYEKELDEHPPAIMMQQGVYTPDQIRAMMAFQSRHPGIYRRMTIPGTSVDVYYAETKISPDRSRRESSIP